MLMERYERAQPHLLRLSDESPKNGELKDLLGRCEERNGRLAEAAEFYRSALSLDPTRIATYVRLANLLRLRLSDPNVADRVMDARVDGDGLMRATADPPRRTWSAPGIGRDSPSERSTPPPTSTGPLSWPWTTRGSPGGGRGRTPPTTFGRLARKHLEHGISRYPRNAACTASNTLSCGGWRPAEGAGNGRTRASGNRPGTGPQENGPRGSRPTP